MTFRGYNQDPERDLKRPLTKVFFYFVQVGPLFLVNEISLNQDFLTVIYDLFLNFFNFSFANVASNRAGICPNNLNNLTAVQKSLVEGIYPFLVLATVFIFYISLTIVKRRNQKWQFFQWEERSNFLVIKIGF